MKTITKIILDKRRAKNDGTYPLSLRITNKCYQVKRNV